MALEPNWRWFGPNDPITLDEIKQTGAKGIVTALHHIPVGEVWPVHEIQKRKDLILSEDFKWRAVESLPVHETIKKRSDNFLQYIENYKVSMKNLAHCGIDTVIYNFMPVLDWSRTDLNVVFHDGSITTKFESTVFAAFDLFILKRSRAEEDYSVDKIQKAEQLFRQLSEEQKDRLLQTVLLGLPGSLESYTLDQFKYALSEYQNINEEDLLFNLTDFLKSVVPVAEEVGVRLAVHPDDPPWLLLGLPRIVNNVQNIDAILKSVNSLSSGLALCTGSLGVSVHNNLVDIAHQFADRIHFSHLRNVTRDADHNFMEDHPLQGDVDLYSVIRELLLEQKRRVEKGRPDTRMPFRPDHGHLMIPEQKKKGIYPGYSLMGRMRALAEIRGMEFAIRRELGME